MNIDEIKDGLIKYGRLLFQKNLSPATSGNISARWGNGCIITGTGTCLGDLTREELVVIDENGNTIDGNMKPSSEKFLHLETYKAKKDTNAIIHTHPVNATAFAVANIDMDLPITPEFIYYFDKVKLAKYAPPGTKELVTNTVEVLKEYNAALMANHGLIVCANDIKTAFYYTETIETTAQIYIAARRIGEPHLLTNEDADFIRQLKRT